MNYQHDATAYQDERELLGTDPVPARYYHDTGLRHLPGEVPPALHPPRTGFSITASRSPHPDRLRN
jgi:hypothetical protein